jgi:hypothetical protein
VATVAHLGGLVEEGWGYLDGAVIQAETSEPLPNVSITIQNPSGWGLMPASGKAVGLRGITGHLISIGNPRSQRLF